MESASYKWPVWVGYSLDYCIRSAVFVIVPLGVAPGATCLTNATSLLELHAISTCDNDEKNLSARKMEATLEMLRSPFSPRLLGHGVLLGDIRGRGVAGFGAVRFAGRNDLPELRQVVVEVVEDALALGRTRACDV